MNYSPSYIGVTNLDIKSYLLIFDLALLFIYYSYDLCI